MEFYKYDMKQLLDFNPNQHCDQHAEHRMINQYFDCFELQKLLRQSKCGDKLKSWYPLSVQQ